MEQIKQGSALEYGGLKDGEPFRRRILYQLNKVGAMEYGAFKDGKPLFFIESDNTDFSQNFFDKFLKEKEAQS